MFNVFIEVYISDKYQKPNIYVKYNLHYIHVKMFDVENINRNSLETRNYKNNSDRNQHKVETAQIVNNIKYSCYKYVHTQ